MHIRNFIKTLFTKKWNNIILNARYRTIRSYVNVWVDRRVILLNIETHTLD